MTDHLPSLLPTDWLASRLGAPGIVTLDASFCLPQQNRNAHMEFAANHIPGAQFFDIDAVADLESPLPHMLPEPEVFTTAVGNMGINNETMVVVYDNNSFMASARVWWTFRVFGHNKIAVLDGGLKAWEIEHNPTVSTRTQSDKQQFVAKYNAHLVRNIDQMKNLIATKENLIVDARSANRFSGTEPESRPGLKSGHIPGSHNLPYNELLDTDTGKLKNANQLAELYREKGINVDAPLVATCGSGVTASILALSLHQLGNTIVPVYDGSWSEWGAASNVPIATGH